MPPDAVKEKAKPDDGTLVADEFEALAGQKVQLDIDDAPFLLDTGEKPAEVPAIKVDAPPAKVEPAAPPPNKKKLIIAGLAVVIVAAAVAAYLLLFGGDAPPTEDVPTAPVIVVPTPPELPTGPSEFITTLAPFWVDLVNEQGQHRFLIASFVLATTDDELNLEITDKVITLRDAIFYYLRNKNYAFLVDPANSELIRSDLLGTVNNYLISGALKSLYFDSYLVQ